MTDGDQYLLNVLTRISLNLTLNFLIRFFLVASTMDNIYA